MRFGYLYNFGITSSPTHHYQYDDVGNRTSVLDLGVTKSYGANSVNAYTSITSITMKGFLTFLNLILLLSLMNGCDKKSNQSIIGVESLRLEKEEIEDLKKKSEEGDGGISAHKLARHYLYFDNDRGTGEDWLRVAISQGNDKAKKELEIMSRH
ncbi:MAG: hypothetical protein B9S37_06820 [Verrucomicrobiia bacterium Tous-C3TDCM]|nr:MAG: hypothetical protein B9S37_06820 [Verrucomicrobiae bacterium Tous-C3TDCM]PAZ03815.1 MAG: hypothetical protein CAK88_13345 [Verrucomicrobiae bacterium AMD-G2]